VEGSFWQPSAITQEDKTGKAGLLFGFQLGKMGGQKNSSVCPDKRKTRTAYLKDAVLW